MTLGATPALAAPPANDDLANATVVTSIPFTEVFVFAEGEFLDATATVPHSGPLSDSKGREDRA